MRAPGLQIYFLTSDASQFSDECPCTRVQAVAAFVLETGGLIFLLLFLLNDIWLIYQFLFDPLKKNIFKANEFADVQCLCCFG